MRAIFMGAAGGNDSDLKKILRKIKVKSSDLLVGVDGGTDTWFRLRYRPDFAIGDWDSLKNRKLLGELPHLSLPQAKDQGDLACAIKAARYLYPGLREMICLDVIGGRRDHELAMIFDLAQACSKPGKALEISALSRDANYHFVDPKMGTWKLPPAATPGSTVSVFAVGGPARGVTLRGCKFSLKNGSLRPSSRGLSNRVTAREPSVSVRSGALMIVLCA